MITLLARTVVVYLTVFITVRLMGKRQISDMQPFDLVITLLMADLASAPVSDTSIPLLHGIIPILTMFMLHRLLAFVSLGSPSVRSLVCGHSITLIEHGVVLEDALHAANYTMSDLMEQLRIKDVFSISDAEYAILETNGSLSVIKSSSEAQAAPSSPAILLLADGRPLYEMMTYAGIDGKKLKDSLNSVGVASPGECLYICLEQQNMLTLQTKQRKDRAPETKSVCIGGK